MKLGLVVQSPSPHQKILLDSLFDLLGNDLTLAYAFADNPGRTWGAPIADGPTTLLPYRPDARCRSRLRDWVQSANCDVWVLGSTFTSLRTQFVADVLARSGRPWAFLGEPPRPRVGLHRLVRDHILQRVLQACHGVIATGTESARRYQRLLADDRPVTSVPYYIPLDAWLANPLVRAPAASEPIRFVTLAQLIHRKGLDILLDACQRLPQGSFSVDVFGDGPLRSRLEKQAAGAGVPITFHRPLPFDRRMEALAGKHCFVFPTRWDGWGMAPVEALAAGLPVISSDQCMSAHDFIQTDSNGWVVPCDAESLARAMQQVIEHRDRLPTMSAAARRSTESYRPEIGAAEIVRFCRELR
jgi:glycosyltransferase involved in cell wall biosynthesis